MDGTSGPFSDDLSHESTPQIDHFHRIFHEIKHPAIRVSPFMETSILRIMEIPSGKHTKNYGKSPFYSWENPL